MLFCFLYKLIKALRKPRLITVYLRLQNVCKTVTHFVKERGCCYEVRRIFNFFARINQLSILCVLRLPRISRIEPFCKARCELSRRHVVPARMITAIVFMMATVARHVCIESQRPQQQIHALGNAFRIREGLVYDIARGHNAVLELLGLSGLFPCLNLLCVLDAGFKASKEGCGLQERLLFFISEQRAQTAVGRVSDFIGRLRELGLFVLEVFGFEILEKL